jgi:hypothetical protein
MRKKRPMSRLPAFTRALHLRGACVKRVHYPWRHDVLAQSHWRTDSQC